jgi:Transcriptional regulator, AbiEi antitoxin, Type IV TA system
MNALAASPPALEKAVAAKLRELLGSVPWLRDWHVSQNPAQFNRAFDVQARVPLPTGNVAELWVVCHDLPRPSRFPYVALDSEFHADGKRTMRVPVLAAPFISDRMAELCDKHQWSWFDLAGNCRLMIPEGVFIERCGKDPVYRRPKPAANLGTAESARIIRALLAPQNVRRRWTQRDMQRNCDPGVSVGLVNKVVLFLREQAFLMDHAEGGFHLHDPVGLLMAWRAAYRFDRHLRRGYFTLKHGRQLRETLASLESATGGHAAYAAFSAADFQAPNVRQPKTWLFVGAEWEDEFAARVEAKSVDSGENLVVLIPEDNGVFYLNEAESNRLACTNPVQTYVDLFHCGGRGGEAADALLEHNLKPAWIAQGVNL